jgi:hypothetical protein
MTLVSQTPDDASDDTPQQQPIPIEVDYLIHTDEHPFCGNPTCYCGEDPDNIAQVNYYYQEGLISADDATRIVRGETL